MASHIARARGDQLAFGLSPLAAGGSGAAESGGAGSDGDGGGEDDTMGRAPYHGCSDVSSGAAGTTAASTGRRRKTGRSGMRGSRR
jgi:hypothetical protein